MARRKRGPTKPGRESVPRKPRKIKSSHPAIIPSASSRLKSYNSIVTDRAKFLRANAIQSKTFRTANAARMFARKVERETGIVYKVRGTKATLVKVDRAKVKSSSSMKRIVNDLKSKSNSARGRKAKALQELGRRESFYDFAVGETNPE